MEVISMLKTGLMNLLEKAMSGSTVRHNVLSNNISNANTPGFKEVMWTFAQHLMRQLIHSFP